ncbi:hypothetical protein AC578_2412 [Pseudocercospora eumusae]|uniref:Nonsense-mediated mRNA decay factor n=1 Tax=Pseudocercospora eumusae TaxID=321146 RepID=A0A139HXJ5_9PEZI|nr:hypothetical protein AC578_2412 [Pseudocercospora eumusae]
MSRAGSGSTEAPAPDSTSKSASPTKHFNILTATATAHDTRLLSSSPTPTILHSSAAATDTPPDGPRHHFRLPSARLHLTTSTAQATDRPCRSCSSVCYESRAAHHKSMEGLLERETFLEQNVHKLLENRDTPLPVILEGFDSYRQACQAVVLADPENAQSHEMRLWAAHGAGRTFFHRALSQFRKNNPDRVVETRMLIKFFLSWIKHGEKFYRAFILQLSTSIGGIPELEAIAQHDKSNGETGESQPANIPSVLRDAVLESCHRTLVYLGDLSRYRAAEKLDKEPDFGPAIGYYALAASLKPRSGLGQHQLAVVALGQSRHLTAIYHLYRSLAVEHPHPNADKNLRLEFDKTNSAWDKGELIQKGMPNDPDASKHALVGWFVRLHGMCFRGEQFRAHEELEREVLSQLFNVLKQRALDGTLMRMVLVNIAAQYIAGEGFQAHQTAEYQQSFYYFFRFNLKTFTALLRTFYDDLRALLINMDDHDVELEKKLTDNGRRLLPCLRVYNNWLLTSIRMVIGLADDDFVGDAVTHFWPMYAKTLDLMAQAFPIWDLDDISTVTYMLEEDVDTLEFRPVLSEETTKTWYLKPNNTVRPRFSARETVRVSVDEEMLWRVRAFLEIGVNLASSDNAAPIYIRGTRIFSGDESRIEPLTVPEKDYTPAPIAPPSKAKPVSYARAAANGHARSARPVQAVRKPSGSKAQTKDVQLSRMVDDLVEDDGVDEGREVNKPLTPPQPVATNPSIVADGEAPLAFRDSVHDLPAMHTKPPKYVPRPSAQDFIPQQSIAITTPAVGRTPPGPVGSERAQRDRLQSVSKLWKGSVSPSFPSGLPTGTLGSPVALNARVPGHSRVNSASSMRSRNSLNVVDSWGSTTDSSAPRILTDTAVANTVHSTSNHSKMDHSGMASPLLFGGGGGLWSTGRGFLNGSPSYGQGG